MRRKIAGRLRCPDSAVSQADFDALRFEDSDRVCNDGVPQRAQDIAVGGCAKLGAGPHETLSLSDGKGSVTCVTTVTVAESIWNVGDAGTRQLVTAIGCVTRLRQRCRVDLSQADESRGVGLLSVQ